MPASTTTREERSTRIQRLNTASLKRVIEPDEEVLGEFTRDQVAPSELLSICDLGIELTPEQSARLAREEVASVLMVGINFETVLISAFAFQLSLVSDVTDPRFAYALHEIGEETRHSRLFARLVGQLQPETPNPIDSRFMRWLQSATLPALMRRPATLDTFVLGGEEIPDLLQKLLVEHPDTDPYLRAVNRYHRAEEARHLAFARTVVAEHYQSGRRSDRFAVNWLAPLGIALMFDTIVNPAVYRTVGLAPFSTWRKVRKSPTRVAMRNSALRAVLRALVDSGVYRRGHVPYAWRRACAVNRRGEPLAA